MNPLFLLLGVFGAASMSIFGSAAKGHTSSNETSTQGIEDFPASKGINENDGSTQDPGAGKSQSDNQSSPKQPVGSDAPDTSSPIGQPTNSTNDTSTGSDITGPKGPTQSGDGGGGADNQPTAISSGTTNVVAGRVATLEPSGDVADVRIISGVEHGSVNVNPDNTFALVMTGSDFIGSQSFTYEATLSDGTTSLHQVNLNVEPGLQDGGWGTGQSHYMLETDENDSVVVEHGVNHIKVFVSGSSSALSLGDIARMEGMPVSQVTGEWLANHGGYGQTENMALAEDAGNALWGEVSGAFSETSNWLLLERGYDYGDMDLLARGASGESELNPLYVGAWGDGARPEITAYSEGFLNNNTSSNIVMQDLHFSAGYRLLSTENVILDGIKVTDKQFVVMHSSGVTIRNSEFYDCTTDASSSTSGTWSSAGDRQQGLFANFNDGMMVEGLFLDHNGWVDGYDPSASTDSVQPPGIHSHNLYFGTSITDLTVRDSISMRGGSNGMILRSGGFFEDLVLIDNNSAIVFKGGDQDGEGQTGQYTLLTDSLVTSGAHRDSSINTGGLTLGIRDEGELSTLVDNIVTHLADPDNPQELASKTVTHSSVSTQNTYYDDTIVYDWQGSGKIYDQVTEQNTAGLDASVLDQTTIQNFTAQLLGQNDATIADLANYLRAQADDGFADVVDADLIIRFFQEGFGITPDIRTDATTLHFVPSDLGEGLRWDNRLNWNTEDLPGEIHPEDNVDLGGNHVVFGSNASVDTLDFGVGGSLSVYGGRLDITGGVAGSGNGDLNIEGAGQVWTTGSSADDLDIAVLGGRFANVGNLQNSDLTVSGGQSILASGGEFDLAAGHVLAVNSSEAQVGFDGEAGSYGILDMHADAKLVFSAEDGDLGMISEFRSGSFGDQSEIQSGIDLGGATLEVDLAGLSADAGTVFTLMSADEIVGLFDDAIVGGLGGRDANIVIDYVNDSVTLQLSSGAGAVSIETLGNETEVTSGEQAIWDLLTADHGVVQDSAAAAVPDESDLLDTAA